MRTSIVLSLIGILIQPPSASALELRHGADPQRPAVILRTRTDHRSTQFEVTAVGSGLSGSSSVALVATDGSWRAPLTLAQDEDGEIVARGSFAAAIPACLLEARIGDHVVTAAVEADPPPPILAPQAGCQQQFIEDIYPPSMIQAKDFAFVAGGWTTAGSWKFHLFYIRQNQLMSPASTSKNLGHAVSDDLDQWTVLDTAAVSVRPGRFDSDHVWAPSIVRHGLTFTMFYTGVDAGQNQRIGIAVSTDLVNWVQGESVLSAGSIDWADASPPPPLYARESQLRDPFVMENPDEPGHWLMYFVTVPAAFSPGMVVGVAKSTGDLSTWGDSSPLWATLRPYVPGALGQPAISSRVQSPHVFRRDGKWWLFHTVNTAADDTIHAVSNLASPADTVAANWSLPRALQFLVPPSEAGAYRRWHATEYLGMSEPFGIQYLAASNDLTTGISYTQMRPAAPPYLFSGDCPTAVSVESGGGTTHKARLLLVGAHPSGSDLRLRVELEARTSVDLTIIDVRGRRVRSLVHGELSEGVTDIRWDGRDLDGARVPSGVYFGRLETTGSRIAVRVPIVR